MTLITLDPRAPAPFGARSAHAPREGNGPLIVLRLYVILLFVVPSNATIKVIGATGFAAGIVAMGSMGLYLAWVLLGLHHPRRFRYPTRWTWVALWLTTLVSYIALQFRARTPLQSSSADRWLLFLMGLTAIATLAAEGLRTFDQLMSLLRTLLWAATFCAVVAAMQFYLNYNIAPTIGGNIPGFHYDGTFSGIEYRGALARVPGMTINPLELGSVSSMLLPLAIAVAVIDKDKPGWRRFVPVALIGMCIPMSVSRTAVLASAVAMLFLLLQARRPLRLTLLGVIPAAAVGVFAIMPGFLTTITGFFLGAGTDTSVRSRTDDYAFVGGLVAQHPWFGTGGGTYLPATQAEIFDNSYLKWVVEFGYVGLAVLLIGFMLLPVATAVTVRRRTDDARYALLAAALSGGLAATVLATATYDALAFPVNSSLEALFIGLTGTVWVQALRGRTVPDPHPRGHALPEIPMDTLNIWRAIRRNLLPVLVIAVMTVGGAVWLNLVTPTRYQVSSSLVLVPPPSSPTDAQMLMHPEWRRLDPDNPYTRNYDPGTVLQLLAIPTTSDAGKAEIRADGGTADFHIQQIYSYGFSTPFSTVTSTGSTPAEAIRTNRIVLQHMEKVLETMQAKAGTSERYFVTTRVAAGATVNPVKHVRPVMRTIEVLVLGLLAAYAAVGVGDAIRISRGRRLTLGPTTPAEA